jgi:arylsulfatase A-like enzyme
MLNRAVVPIIAARPGYTATHGSPYDYDRRVPLLFWRKGLPGMEQPQPVETVDIAPTLAALIGLKVPQGLSMAAVWISMVDRATPACQSNEAPNTGWLSAHHLLRGGHEHCEH